MGIHVYLQQVVRLLGEAGASVTLLTNFAPGGLEREYPSVEWKPFGSRRNLLWDQISLPRLLRRSTFDLYWAPGNMGIPGVSVRPVKTVLTLHDLIPLKLPRMYLIRRPLFAGPYLVWTTAGAVRADTIFAVSEASAQDLRALYRREATVAAPILFKDVIAASTPREETLREAAELIEPGTRYVVYNGGLEARKNVPALIEGFRIAQRANPSLHLVLMGRGYERVRGAIRGMGLERRVVLTGFVSEALKAAILQGAQALIYPSLYEGFGLPVLEAFANRVPVVTSARGSLKEVAGEAALYIADPIDARSIADALRQMQDPSTREALREAGAARWEAYDAEAVRDLVVSALRAALDG